MAAAQAGLPGGLTGKQIAWSSVTTKNQLIGFHELMTAVLRIDVPAPDRLVRCA